MRHARVFGAVVAFTLFGCGDDSGDDDDDGNDGGTQSDGGRDASADGGRDAGGDASLLDAARDAASDAASGDARVDASVSDAAADASLDAAADASADAATDASTDAATLESWSAIYADILMPRCSSCHNAPGSGGLNMSSASTAYDELLLAAEGPSCTGMGTRVVPGNAAGSLIIQKLTLPEDQVCGNPMPRPTGGAAYMQLPAGQIERIRTWINQGALEN